mmetsp:Transcript_11311/g.23156  ORF Transcript_11311/g.23156 Transcript_11311/m.23156 type:complete len:521 (-) Transcript_11311:25-1587(-)|eukprot:CAMPEP_0172460940 /NCGR_PEP_ID=MMETSP1065-20121228/38903_1 /TAXON_ID=265537 /ORGANISM="Amphiprora paludosa, Strain CCMP125" /LENGTH=520 /DNA_ID=CAMNT_0013216119 /DNA_START=166 /DNA_END=1728 /DNA_ORIENTATION=+
MIDTVRFDSLCSWFIQQMGDVTWAAPVATLTSIFIVAIWSWSSSRSKNAVPWGSAHIFRCVAELSGKDAPWFFLEQAKAVMADTPGKKKPPIVVYRLPMPIPGGFYVVGDGALARKILLDTSSDKPAALYDKPRPVNGGISIFNSSTRSPHWKRSRKALAPAFGSKEIQRMNEICQRHVEQWLEETLESPTSKPDSFDPAVELTKLTLRVLCEAACEYQATDDEIQDFLDNLEVALREFVMRQLHNPLRYYLRFFLPQHYQAHQAARNMQNWAKHMMTTYRARKQQSSSTSDSTSNTLIKLIVEHPEMTEQVRISEVVTFLIAGHDTTGYTLSNALTLLAQNPQIAKKLQSELRQQSSPKQWSNVPYFQYVLQEVHRFFPVAAMGSLRYLDQDLVIPLPPNNPSIDGDEAAGEVMVIPKQSNIFMPLLLIHRNEHVYDNPNIFDPSRWAQATPAMKQSLMPFSVGMRNCIGQSLANAEIQAVLPRLIHDYDFEIQQEGTPDNFLTLKFTGTRLRAKRSTH